MGYNVVVSPAALQDLYEIEHYLMERSPSGARNVLADIKCVFDLLAFSTLGVKIEGTTFRHQITPRYRYRIVYRLRNETLTIRRVYGPRQLPNERAS